MPKQALLQGFADELAEWLLNLDRGKGVMLEYHEALQ